MQPSAKLINTPDQMFARKHFVLGDTEYQPGDPFFTHPDNVAGRRLRQLWDQRKIGTAADLQKDKDRYAARVAAETSAKTSANKLKPEPLVTADDLEI